jgi:arylsulfatase A-like enzyme
MRNILLLACLLSACDDKTAEAPSDGGADASVARPNLIFVLSDDLSWNLVKFMPHVLEMQQKGLTFSHYFVTDSLCCPSRSSIFTGKYPHNTGVFTNGGDAGGYLQFEKRGNATQTFSGALSAAGYRTAMMGKYLNGYEPTQNQKDPGWGGWDVAGDGYPEFDYDLNEDGTVRHYGDGGSDYLTDVLSGLAGSFVSGGSPYFLEVATFAPHAPYTPAPRNVGMFHETIPRLPTFNTANTNPPQWLAVHPPLTPKEIASLDDSFNLRAEAVQALDDLIGSLMAKMDGNTYLFFSSDNGYHMGDHMLPAGKQTIFDHDINVPLVVMGPGIPAGVTLDQIVENIDLCPTFAELGGGSPPSTVDGHSLLPLFSGMPAADWRNVALIEHRGPDVQPMDPGDPDNEDRTSTPNSYEAIRMQNSIYAEYFDGETEYYDLTSDPLEQNNTAAALSAAQVNKFHQAIVQIRGCQGTAACWAAQKL